MLIRGTEVRVRANKTRYVESFGEFFVVLYEEK